LEHYNTNNGSISFPHRRMMQESKSVTTPDQIICRQQTHNLKCNHITKQLITCPALCTTSVIGKGTSNDAALLEPPWSIKHAWFQGHRAEGLSAYASSSLCLKHLHKPIIARVLPLRCDTNHLSQACWAPARIYSSHLTALLPQDGRQRRAVRLTSLSYNQRPQ